MKESKYKAERILSIYTRLLKGQRVNRLEEAFKYKVSERTIQRDIDDIRNFLAGSSIYNEVVYNSNQESYILINGENSNFNNSEILTICKILLSSRAFSKNKIEEILDKLILFCSSSDNKKLINSMIKNEIYHYIELKENVNLDNIWILSEAIYNKRYIEIDYFRSSENKVVKRYLKPAAILFSEFYFYLAAFIEDEKIKENFEVKDDKNPTIYRIDKIKNIKISNKVFNTMYNNRFQEGDFINKIQFMYGGKLIRLKLRYVGNDVNYILDKIPTAKIVHKNNNEYIIDYVGYGKGIFMWLKSQENIEIID